MRLRTLAAALLLAPATLAQSYDFTLDSLASNTLISLDVALPLPGTAIGSYDATTNPTGTITCTNIFGTCNNTSFPINSTLTSEPQIAGEPSGTFRANVNTTNGSIAITGLAVSPAGRQAHNADLTLELNYPTFRTRQPNSVFPGGFTVPLPIGQGTIDNVLLVQEAPAVGTLTASGTPDVWNVNIVVPTRMTFDLDMMGNAGPVGPVPFALPLVGTLDVSGVRPRLVVTVDQSGSQTIPNPSPGTAIEDIPFAIPTVFPAGGTANLVLDLVPGDLTLGILSDLDWAANGMAACTFTSYCSSTPNTFSTGGECAALGSSSLAVGGFALSATGVPPAHAGRFYMSRSRNFLPFGDGNLCLGAPVRRLPVTYAGPLGNALYPIVFSDPSQPTALIRAGDVWNFQFIFRDPIGGPLTFNTTNAVSVQFCP
ncbi:MAG: hypothetical protein FJ298_05550 [Planctomycetes bacterium]|nr:hypothetical protein [Planctomycetota bacterium]